MTFSERNYLLAMLSLMLISCKTNVIKAQEIKQPIASKVNVTNTYPIINSQAKTMNNRIIHCTNNQWRNNDYATALKALTTRIH